MDSLGYSRHICCGVPVSAATYTSRDELVGQYRAMNGVGTLQIKDVKGTRYQHVVFADGSVMPIDMFRKMIRDGYLKRIS